MHEKNLYHDTQSTYSFFTRGDGIGKTFTLNLIIQGLLESYNIDTFLDLTKTKALLMAYITKVAFNINSLKYIQHQHTCPTIFI